MSRRAAPPDDDEPELLDARVRVGRVSVHQMIRTAYSITAILFWGGSALAAWRLAPGAVHATTDLAQAVTRASLAIERSTESAARLEVSTARLEGKVDRLADICGRPCPR